MVWMAKKKTPTKKPRIKTVEDQSELTKEEKTQAAQDWITDKPTGEKTVATATNKAKKKAPAKKGRKAGVNKSAAVRKYAKDHPKATTQEIATALKFDYGTVYQATKKKGVKKAKPSSKAPSHTGNGHSASEFIKTAFGLGLDRAITLLTKVKKAIE